jgi:uncharacterized phage infection (PIP) family protein YhgE
VSAQPIHEAGLQEDAQQKVVADLTTMNSKLGDLNSGITQTVSKLGELNAGINQTVQALAESSSISKKINQALGSQLGILTEQQRALSQQAGVLNEQLAVQKQQWDKENQRPAILVITGIGPVEPWQKFHISAYLDLGPRKRLSKRKKNGVRRKVSLSRSLARTTKWRKKLVESGFDG